MPRPRPHGRFLLLLAFACGVCPLVPAQEGAAPEAAILSPGVPPVGGPTVPPIGGPTVPPIGGPTVPPIGGPTGWQAPQLVWVSDEELLLHEPYTRGFRSLYWYFSGLLTDGTKLTISLFQWRYGRLGGPGLLVVLGEPGRPALVIEERIEERSFEESGQRLHVRFGDSELTGSRAGCSVHLRLSGFSCDLEMSNLLNPWRPGDGYLFMSPDGEAYTRHTVIAPFATVSGRITVGERAIAAQGWCYSDRGLVCLPVRRLNPEESSFRVFGPGITPQGEPWMISALYSVSAEAYGSRRTFTLLVGRGRQWLLAAGGGSFEALDFSRQEGTPYPYPRRLRVRAAQEGYALEGEFVVTELIARNDILERLPRPFRKVAEAFINRPVMYRLGGYFLGSLQCPDGTREILYLAGHGEYCVYR